MVNCDFTNGGCNGGWLSNAVNYLVTDGVVADTCLPYASSEGRDFYCKFRCESPSVMYRKYYCKKDSVVMPITTEDIQMELMTNGPMMVGFTVYSDFVDYSGGIYEYTYGEYEGSHAVKLIGWNVDSGSGRMFWICENEWDSNWGETGYFRIFEGQAGIATLAIGCTPEIS